MKPVIPSVVIPGDNDKKDMAKHGGLLGISYFHMVWRFGFLPGTDYAKYYGVSTPHQVYVLTSYGGKVQDTFVGAEADLPKKFKSVIDFKFLFSRDMAVKAGGLHSTMMDDGVEDRE